MIKRILGPNSFSLSFEAGTNMENAIRAVYNEVTAVDEDDNPIYGYTKVGDVRTNGVAPYDARHFIMKCVAPDSEGLDKYVALTTSNKSYAGIQVGPAIAPSGVRIGPVVAKFSTDDRSYNHIQNPSGGRFSLIVFASEKWLIVTPIGYSNRTMSQLTDMQGSIGYVDTAKHIQRKPQSPKYVIFNTAHISGRLTSPGFGYRALEYVELIPYYYPMHYTADGGLESNQVLTGESRVNAPIALWNMIVTDLGAWHPRFATEFNEYPYDLVPRKGQVHTIRGKFDVRGLAFNVYYYSVSTPNPTEFTFCGLKMASPDLAVMDKVSVLCDEDGFIDENGTPKIHYVIEGRNSVENMRFLIPS